MQIKLTIVVCTNHEVLGCDRDQVATFESAVGRLDFPDGIDYRFENQFRYWNGGPGYRLGIACLHVGGFGTVPNAAKAAEAIEYMIAHGGTDAPTSRDIAGAFAAIDRILEIEILPSDSPSMFAAYDAEKVIWGTGETEDDAMTDARSWIGLNHESPSDILETLTADPCTSALVAAVISRGGQIQWQWSGTLSRYMTLRD